MSNSSDLNRGRGIQEQTNEVDSNPPLLEATSEEACSPVTAVEEPVSMDESRENRKRSLSIDSIEEVQGPANKKTLSEVVGEGANKFLADFKNHFETYLKREQEDRERIAKELRDYLRNDRGESSHSSYTSVLHKRHIKEDPAFCLAADSIDPSPLHVDKQQTLHNETTHTNNKYNQTSHINSIQSIIHNQNLSISHESESSSQSLHLIEETEVSLPSSGHLLQSTTYNEVTYEENNSEQFTLCSMVQAVNSDNETYELDESDTEVADSVKDRNEELQDDSNRESRLEDRNNNESESVAFNENEAEEIVDNDSEVVNNNGQSLVDSNDVNNVNMNVNLATQRSVDDSSFEEANMNINCPIDEFPINDPTVLVQSNLPPHSEINTMINESSFVSLPSIGELARDGSFDDNIGHDSTISLNAIDLSNSYMEEDSEDEDEFFDPLYDDVNENGEFITSTGDDMVSTNNVVVDLTENSAESVGNSMPEVASQDSEDMDSKECAPVIEEVVREDDEGIVALEEVDEEIVALEEVEEEIVASEEVDEEMISSEEVEEETVALEEVDGETIALKEVEEETVALEQVVEEIVASEEVDKEMIASEEVEEETVALEEVDEEMIDLEEVEEETVALEQVDEEMITLEKVEEEMIVIEQVDEEMVVFEEVDELAVNDTTITAHEDINENAARYHDEIGQIIPLHHTDRDMPLTNWKTIEEKLVNSHKVSPFPPYRIDKVVSEDGSLELYWTDVYEENHIIFIYGKVLKDEKFVSCCIRVENMKREIFILPRKFKLDERNNTTDSPVTLEDVKTELKDLIARKGIEKYEMKEARRKNISDSQEADYVLLTYDFHDYQFQEGFSGRTFAYAFGATTNATEHFLISKNIMGPCWLRLRNVKANCEKETWCSVEGSIINVNDCNVISTTNPPPPLTVMSLQLETYYNCRSNTREVLCINGFISFDVDIHSHQTTTQFPYKRFSHQIQSNDTSEMSDEESLGIIMHGSELSLLNGFIAMLNGLDPDVLIFHGFSNGIFNVLLQRLKAVKCVNWSGLGRRKRVGWPTIQSENSDSTFVERKMTAGRLVCDTYVAAKDLVREKSYTITDLAATQLGIRCEECSPVCTEMSFTELSRRGFMDAYIGMALTVKLQILPLTKHLTNLAGNTWARTIRGARSERNEYLLLHTFYNKGYVYPNKAKKTHTNDDIELETFVDTRTDTQKKSYTGGLVLEPQAGSYDSYVILLDYNSLYPTIIQEFNVCFTTMGENESAEGEICTPKPSLPEGILPGLVRTFVDRRKEVKKLMKDASTSKTAQTQYDIEQMALKLTANSMYGCLGSSTSRFYALPLAEYITRKGREILRSTVEIAKSMNYNVIYGDTDSVMIDTKCYSLKQATCIAEEVKGKINEKYRLLEIGADAYFRHTLLLKKKKYAALTATYRSDGKIEQSMEVKGLDMVRKDWSSISNEASKRVLQIILETNSAEDRVKLVLAQLKDVKLRLEDKSGIALEEFIIRKQLTKNPQEYRRDIYYPHVEVAKEMRRNGISVTSGDTIPYIMTVHQGQDGRMYRKASIPTLISLNDVDMDWYLKKQILPPVCRLCIHNEGLDLKSISDSLGLKDDSLLAIETDGHGKQSKDLGDAMDVDEQDVLTITCRKCNHVSIVEGNPILRCQMCDSLFDSYNLYVVLDGYMRKVIEKYYHSGYVCNEDGCGYRTMDVPIGSINCRDTYCPGSLTRSYDHKKVQTSLQNIEHFAEDPMLRDLINRYSENFDFRYVNLTDMLEA